MKGLNRYLKIIGIILSGILIVGYASFQIVRVLNGATLSVREPSAGATFSKPLITVSGEATRAAFISLNDREILTDESGHFAEELLLAEGYNVLTVRMKDRFGALREETREVVYRRE